MNHIADLLAKSTLHDQSTSIYVDPWYFDIEYHLIKNKNIIQNHKNKIYNDIKTLQQIKFTKAIIDLTGILSFNNHTHHQ